MPPTSPGHHCPPAPLYASPVLTVSHPPQRQQVHELAEDKLKQREVIHIDIANDPIIASDYKEAEDPKKFKSQKTGRGPLVGADWMKKQDPVMTCYKLVTCEFKWFGLQGRLESFIQRSEKRLFTTFHR